MRKQSTNTAIVCAMLLWLTACGDQSAAVSEDQTVPYVEENEEPLDSKQIPEDIIEQIRVYVEQRDIWLFEQKDPYIYYYYAWNDLNQDGKLELICSWNAGTGRYSRDYVYTVNSNGEVECVIEIKGDVAPDLLWGLELYADEHKGEKAPEHFYIRSHDYTPDGPYYYDSDMVVAFTGDLTEWQLQRIRRSVEKYDDITHNSEPVNTEYYNGDGEPVSREEWERLEKEFLEGKEFITSDFEWDELGSCAYDECKEIYLSDQELGEALEELYMSWQELINEN